MSQRQILRKPELMSPAGHWPQLRAAIEAGADAVYFGLNQFSARAKVGFEIDELPEVIRTLHGRGVKGFLTFNTLVFERELDIAAELLPQVIEAGTDAVIVQDFGIAKWLQQVAPQFPVHGSTQMSVTSAEGAEFARSLGCSRIVLGRELSLQEIRKIRERTDVELEVFVHGALCVSYSGQCFSSEAWGGRSANRGQCAQACRLSYELIVDGQARDLGPARYLLSPGDLYGLEQVSQLVDIGVSCLKIEGRYKDADYVALATQAYRQAIDAACANQNFVLCSEMRQDLEQVYSRGMGPHFLVGTNHQAVVGGRAPRHRGLFAGRVIAVRHDGVVAETKLKLNRGDGIVFDAADRRSPEITEQGGFLFDVRTNESGTELYFDPGKVRFADIQVGDLIWRTHDPQLSKKIKHLTQAVDPVRTEPIDFKLIAAIGRPIELIVSDRQGRAFTLRDSDPLPKGKTTGTLAEQAKSQLERLGGTPFRLDQFEFHTDGQAFLPASWLNRIRRAAIEQLQLAWQQSNPVPISILQRPPTTPLLNQKQSEIKIRLHALVRNDAQLNAALLAQVDSITLDYLELYGLRPAVERIKATGISPRVASPRILKPAEEKIVNFLRSLECDLLVRSTGLLWQLAQRSSDFQPGLYGDFSLNATNSWSASVLLGLGLIRITPGYDLNAAQIVELANQVGSRQLEVVLFQNLPIFHTEHCLFCRFLSNGRDSSDCGHPCEKHRVAVRDDRGRIHPVMADVGCRNTMFNAEVQSGTSFLTSFRKAGLAEFRIEFVHQTAGQVESILHATRSYFEGRLNERELELVFAQNSFGLTQGSFFVPSEDRDNAPSRKSKDAHNLVQLNTKSSASR